MDFEAFKTEFGKQVVEEEVDWVIRGILLANDRVYVLGSDTKVLSTVFELLCGPLVRSIAEDSGYRVEESVQTVYPDFTLLKDSQPKIAIDVKTTYRRFAAGGLLPRPFRYTLGSYTSFLRNGTKNIAYPYTEYGEHWVIGFLYSRANAQDQDFAFDLEERGKIRPPYRDVEYFVQEKYKIVGESPASGNTANLGSFATADIEDLRKGCGPFAALGKEVCDEYWRNYARNREGRPYSTIQQYLEWRRS